MKRQITNKTLTGHKSDLLKINIPKKNNNYCLLPNRTSMTREEELIIKYKKLVSEMKEIRGKLYRLGINPDNYL